MTKEKKSILRVPTRVKSRESDEEVVVMFKNLTEENVDLYWIDYNGKAIHYCLLLPMKRNDEGEIYVTFVTHPWIAVVESRCKQLLLNGSRFFFPPSPTKWENKPLGWANAKWIVKDSFDTSNNDDERFEVLVESPAPKSLLQLCLISCCSVYEEEDFALLNLPKTLTRHFVRVLNKYFLKPK